MSYCRICGTDRQSHNVEWRTRSNMTLCASCHRDTPRKVSRTEFDRLYWGSGPEADSVPESIRREFFDDYRTSTYGPVADYKAATTSDAW